MRYIPYGRDLERVPNIVVGGGGNDATALELSQRPGNATRGLFVRRLAQYLRDNAADEVLLWSPFAADDAGVEETSGD